ncbi:uncharacterized protein LOC129915774 [Episyrphus balteatus]|uniref:uncharacterized protein LOC129915774 n=1 Tax=Episyrphus balteatus TaxID=286459 RepID=UPI0024864DD8|nr:uncharacterized protein LOC129915774 [Episyrphus balteatus]
MFKDSFEEQLRVLTDEKDWEGVLKLSETLPLDKKSKYLWTWPTGEALQIIKSTLHELGIGKLLSVGCGTGLLEWIIKESIGAAVYGLEVDRSWWESSYSPISYIKLNFINDVHMDPCFLQECCDTKDWDFGMVFCYFNNGKAFHDYLRLYKGSVVIIIGPAPGVGIHTDPPPLKADFCDSGWKMLKYFNISKDDIISFYTKS